MATSDVYEVRMYSTFLGVDCFNLFYYQQVGDDPNINQATIMAQAFRAHFGVNDQSGAFANDAFVAAWQYVSLTVRNLFDPVEFAVILDGATNLGTATTTRMPAWAAYRFVAPRQRGDMRNGQKFFPGVPESYGDDGVLAAGIKTFLESLEVNLGTAIEQEVGADTLVFVPVIVKRVKETDAETGEVSYRLPTSLGEAFMYNATEWAVSDILSTMGSRKS